MGSLREAEKEPCSLRRQRGGGGRRRRRRRRGPARLPCRREVWGLLLSQCDSYARRVAGDPLGCFLGAGKCLGVCQNTRGMAHRLRGACVYPRLHLLSPRETSKSLGLSGLVSASRVSSQMLGQLRPKPLLQTTKVLTLSFPGLPKAPCETPSAGSHGGAAGCP